MFDIDFSTISDEDIEKTINDMVSNGYVKSFVEDYITKYILTPEGEEHFREIRFNIIKNNININ